MSSSPVEQLRRALDDTGQLIAAVRAVQLSGPTPCADWAVRDLVAHLIAGNYLFASALRVESPSPRPDGADGPDGQALVGAYRDSVEVLLAAFELPGALERVVTVPFGSVPGIVALHLRVVEALVHGWDLARATGQPCHFADELAEQELEFTRVKLGDLPPGRSPFGPPRPVADDAPAIDRLAACLGRNVDSGPVA